MIVISNGKIYINGEETKDPTLIGYAVLDLLETIKDNNIPEKEIESINVIIDEII